MEEAEDIDIEEEVASGEDTEEEESVEDGEVVVRESDTGIETSPENGSGDGDTAEVATDQENGREDEEEEEKELKEPEEPEGVAREEVPEEELEDIAAEEAGKSREPVIHTPGGASEEESTDGDSLEDFQDNRATGTSEDTRTSVINVEVNTETGNVLELTGGSSVSKKEETSLLIET